MVDLKTTAEDRLYLSGAIHRMGERTGAAAERVLDDLDTLLAENSKLRAVAEAAKAMRAAHVADDRCEAVMASRRMLVALAALEAP